MIRWDSAPRTSAIAAVIALTISAVSLFGLILKEDPVGQVVFGVTWAIVGLSWIGQSMRARRAQ